MPLSSYCKKCGQDVPVGESCPHCGSKLAANTVRLAWCVEHVPVLDWMCWNAVMRLVMPVVAAMVLLCALLELLIGGPWSVLTALGSLLLGVMGLLGMLVAVLLLVFILQGDDLLDCVIDARGLHVTTYLPEPTRLKLLLRGKPPKLMESGQVLCIQQRDIAWKDVRRVQLWPEKTMILLYSPRWWMRLALPCTPFTWEDALAFIREKIGKKKAVILPESCRQAATAAPKKKNAPRRERQLSVEDVYLPAQPIPQEEVPPEQPGDFIPLADVLSELKEK